MPFSKTNNDWVISYPHRYGWNTPKVKSSILMPDFTFDVFKIILYYIWSEIRFSTFWKFNILKTLFQSLNNAAKMCGRMAWWRNVVDKITRLQYDRACIGYTQLRYLHFPPLKHQSPHCRLKIQNRSTCCFASENLHSDQFCHNTTSQDEITVQ